AVSRSTTKNGSTTRAPVAPVARKRSSSKTSSKKEPLLTGNSRIYLAGPIRGVPDFKDRFAYATSMLRWRGANVFNPVEQDDFFLRVGMPNEVALYLEHDLAW